MFTVSQAVDKFQIMGHKTKTFVHMEFSIILVFSNTHDVYALPMCTYYSMIVLHAAKGELHSNHTVQLQLTQDAHTDILHCIQLYRYVAFPTK